MSESQFHIELVHCITNWVRTCNYLGNDPIVFSDLPNSTIQKTPRIVISHRPDVVAYSRNSGRQIIGEAKTPGDLNKPRSINQLQEFLQYASTNNSALIVATQWDHVRCAKSILKNLCSHLDSTLPKYAVLDQFGCVAANSNDWV